MDRDITKGFLSVFSADAAALAFGLIVTPILVRILGTSRYGEYVFVLSVSGVLVIVANAGINDGVRKFIAEDRAMGSWADHVFGLYVRAAAVLSLVVAALLITATELDVVSALVGEEFENPFRVLAALIVGRQLFLTVRGSLMGLGLEHYSEPLVVLDKVLFGVVGIALALSGWGVSGVLAGHIVGNVVASLVGLAFLTRHVDFSAVWRRVPSGFPRGQLLSFNAWNVVLVLLMTSLYHVDILLLQPLVGSQQTGYYRAALLIAEFLWFVPFALQMVLLHSTSELWAEGRREAVSALASRAVRYTLALTVLLGLGIAALADAFVPLYFGTAFAPAGDLVLYLLPGALGFAVARPIFAVGQGKGSLRALIVATGTAAGLNLALNLVLIPRYGMYGAAAATSVGYGSMLAFHVVAARRIGFDPVGDVRIGRIAASAAVSGTAIAIASYTLESPLLSLAIVPPVGGVTYALVALRLRVVGPDEVEKALSYVPNPVDTYLSRVVRFVG